jgi:hypothetical protein
LLRPKKRSGGREGGRGVEEEARHT